MSLPFFSIVVPTIGRHGRTTALKNCLKALSRLDYPTDRFEIIIVFDGSHSIPLPNVEPITIRTYTQPQSGPAAARNKGAIEAKGDYLAFTDDDCTPAVDWLRQLSAVIAQFPNHMIGGQTLNALPDNSYATASQHLVDFLYNQHNIPPQQAKFLTSNNVALPRRAFLALGGFDNTFPLAAGEDREFCQRWLDQGHHIYYHPPARVHHAHLLTLSTFWRQHVNYGRGAFRFRKKQANQHNKRLSLERPSFYLNLLRHTYQAPSAPKPIRLSLLFLLMQFATATGFLQERLQPH